MRTVENLVSGWTFHADFEAELIHQAKPGEAIRLPHNAVDLELNYFDERSFEKEFGYQFSLPWRPDFEGREVALRFDGAMANSVVWLNGELVAQHKDGYTPFEARLTEGLRRGDNLITVKIDGTENPEIPPFGGQIDYLTYAGIYREVWLQVTDPVSIASLKVETADELTDAKAVNVVLRLSNPRGLHLSGRATVRLSDLEGRQLAQTELAIEGETGRASLTQLAGLALWELDEPTLYRIAVEIETPHGRDGLDTRFGFRTAHFSVDGFRLNGQLLKIRGLNRHQSFPYVGYAMGRRAQARDADILKKELHVNLARTSHYPQSPHFLDRCDEIGLLVFEEIPGWQHIGGATWQDEAVANVQRMIQRDWNHPSIILWGVRINESRDDSALYQRTTAAARELDTTRQIGGVRCIENSELLEDVYTMNDFCHSASAEWWKPRPPYGPVILRQPTEVTGLARDVPYMVTEFNGHMFPTKRIDPEVRQSEHVTRYLQILDTAQGKPGLAGSIGWCMFDYNTHQDFGAGDRICHHGVLDIFRVPKFAASVYASQCAPEEQVVLEAVSYWARGEKDRCEALPMIVLSNCDWIEIQNGTFDPVRIEADRATYPHLPHPPFIVDGSKVGVGEWGWRWHDARITAYLDGEPVAQLDLCGAPVATTLEVKADSDTLLVDEKDAVRFVVRALDQKGRVLPFLDEIITLDVSGGGKLLGPDALAFKGGVAGFWVESTGQGADTSVTVSSRRLGSQQVTLHAV